MVVSAEQMRRSLVARMGLALARVLGEGHLSSGKAASAALGVEAQPAAATAAGAVRAGAAVR
jgi:hypothetical protein